MTVCLSRYCIDSSHGLRNGFSNTYMVIACVHPGKPGKYLTEECYHYSLVYEDRLRSFPSSVTFLIRVMKTEYNQFHVVTWYLPSTIHNLGPTAVHNFGSLPMKMEGCEEMWFKQHAIHWVFDCGEKFILSTFIATFRQCMRISVLI